MRPRDRRPLSFRGTRQLVLTELLSPTWSASDNFAAGTDLGARHTMGGACRRGMTMRTSDAANAVSV